MNQSQIKILWYWDAKKILQISHQNFDNIIKQWIIQSHKISSWTVFYESDILELKQNLEKQSNEFLWYWDVKRKLWISHQYLDKLIVEEKIPTFRISSWTVFLKSDIKIFENQRKLQASSDRRIKIKN